MRHARETLEVVVGDAPLTFHFRGPGAKLGRGEVKCLSIAPDLRQAVGRRVEGAAPAKGQSVQLEIVHSRSVRARPRPRIVSFPLSRCGLPRT